MEIDNNTTVVSRSAFVTTLAWIFIVLGALATIIAIFQNIMIYTVIPFQEMQEVMELASEDPGFPLASKIIFGHFQFILALFLILSVTSFVSAIALLQRKDWARRVYMVLMALGIIWNIGGLVLQQSFFSGMAEPPGAPVQFHDQFQNTITTIRITSYVFTIGFSILFIWIINRLNSDDIKKEFGGSKIQ